MATEGVTGGKDGLAALIEAHRGELLRFLASRCGDADTAQDLLQDLWLRLAGTDTGPINNGRAYLMRAANNLALDRLRTQRRAMTRDRRWLEEDFGGAVSSVIERPDPAPRADRALLDAEEAAVLAAAIARLPEGARRALQLYRFEGMKQHEIADVMGITRSGVEKHLALAMRHLRDALADCGFFGPTASYAQPPKNAGGAGEDQPR